MVLFRAHCCFCELRAAGRAYSHLLLLVQKSKRHIPTYQKNTKHPKHPRLKKHFFSSRNPMYLLAAAINANGDISGMPSMQPTEHPRTSLTGSRVSEHMPLYPSCVHLPEWAVSQAIATGALEARKIMLERTRRIGQAWAVIYLFRSTANAMLEIFLRCEHTKRYTWWG